MGEIKHDIKIKIADAICGVGKTSGAINMINNSDESERFLYITPFLTEVQRIKIECSSKNFKEPQCHGTKLKGIKHLFKREDNIVSTHALFRMFTPELIDLVQLNNYTLILDEVCDVVEILEITKNDLDNILEKYAIIKENGLLEWTDKNYEGKYDGYKNLCELNCVSVYGENSDKRALLWMFPIEVFKAFKEIYLLTYLFDGQIQKYYYDLYDLKYIDIYIKDFKFTEEKQIYDMSIYKDLIKICNHEKLNRIGDKDYTLSRSWYRKNDTDEKLMFSALKRNCENFFRNISKTNSSENLWTTYKDYKTHIKGNGYSKGFATINLRATNSHRNKKTIAYLVNRFFNPIVKNYFIQQDIIIDENKYALSELIQFIFRSQIRDKKEINVYIPSLRMRKLLQVWLDSL